MIGKLVSSVVVNSTTNRYALPVQCMKALNIPLQFCGKPEEQLKNINIFFQNVRDTCMKNARFNHV
jgi:hypothetical protein